MLHVFFQIVHTLSRQATLCPPVEQLISFTIELEDFASSWSGAVDVDLREDDVDEFLCPVEAS